LNDLISITHINLKNKKKTPIKKLKKYVSKIREQQINKYLNAANCL